MSKIVPIVRVLGALCAVFLARQAFGTPTAVIVAVGCWIAGFFPPVFPLVYRAYTTRVGYAARHMLHPRMPPHSNTLPGIRRFTWHKGGVEGAATVVPVPVLADNYSYVIVCEATRHAAVVDPADPERMLAVVQALGGRLTHVLTTHKHWDHAGGNDELVAALAKQGPRAAATVVGSRVDSPAATTLFVEGGDIVRIGDVAVRVVHAPGHTKGSVMYALQPPSCAAELLTRDGVVVPLRPAELVANIMRSVEHLVPQAVRNANVPAATLKELPVVQVDNAAAGVTACLFTGDCIFCGGCGAMFEADGAKDVLKTYDGLHTLAKNAPNALCYVGHEYSERLFAELKERMAVCGDAAAVKAFKTRWDAIRRARAQLECTVPSTLHDEACTNPLMTLRRSVLERHSRGQGSVAELEQAVYMSTERMPVAPPASL